MDTENDYEQMEKNTPSERARRWFERPAYSIRGDTDGYNENGKREKEGVSQKLSKTCKKN